MVSTKSTLTALVFTTLATTALTATNYDGCISINPNGTCADCYNRKLLNDGRCGPVLPKTDKCLIYGIGNNNGKSFISCGLCKTGNALEIDFDTRNITQKCISGSLNDCLYENDVTFGKNTQKTCLACPDGKFSVRNSTTQADSCQKIAQPVPNCKWGSFYSPEFKKAECFRCNDGYAVNTDNKQCSTTVGVGCWMQQGGKCLICNPWEGYSINAKGTCLKTTGSAVVDHDFHVKNVLNSLGFGRF